MNSFLKNEFYGLSEAIKSLDKDELTNNELESFKGGVIYSKETQNLVSAMEYMDKDELTNLKSSLLKNVGNPQVEFLLNCVNKKLSQISKSR